MRKPSQAIALLLCTALLLAAAPTALAEEPSPSAGENEPILALDVWGFVATLVGYLLPSQDESPAGAADGTIPPPSEDDATESPEPEPEQFGFPDPNG